MKERQVLDDSETPDGSRMQLAIEGPYHVIRVDGAPLMSSAAYGSEQEMARVAAEKVAGRSRCRVLVGGLGFGFTLRAVLDGFGEDARVTVAELLPQLVRYNRELLGELAGEPLSDPRVTLFEGDVREPIRQKSWDAILLDVDNGPDAFTTKGNGSLYGRRGCENLARALAPGGVAIVWSAFPSDAYEKALQRAGLQTQALRVRARTDVRKGPKHTLFVATRPVQARKRAQPAKSAPPRERPSQPPRERASQPKPVARPGGARPPKRKR